MAKLGDLRVWWIPQVPMEPFYVPVDSPEEAARVVEILAAYDDFQFKNNVKPDYSNVGGLQIFETDSDGEVTPGWVDWYTDDGDFDEFRQTLTLPDYWGEGAAS